MKIWVVLQLREGSVHPMARETVAAGQRLAASGGGTVEAVVLGHQLGAVTEELTGLDLATVHVCDHPALESYDPGAYADALAPAIRAHAPDFVLFPHSYQSVDYVPGLAQALEAPLVPEMVSFSNDGEGLLFRRPVFGGKLQCDARVRAGESAVLMTVQSGAFSASSLASGTATVSALEIDGQISGNRETLGVEEASAEEVDLSQADVIVAVGRGVGGADKMSVVEELAEALGAEIGASRPVIDSGWLPRDRQIGSSGQTVAPKLYLAVGISGAIQHLVGMKGSQIVVAINKDANAPIFGVADYGVVGDLHEVVPALTSAIREAKSE